MILVEHDDFLIVTDRVAVKLWTDDYEVELQYELGNAGDNQVWECSSLEEATELFDKLTMQIKGQR